MRKLGALFHNECRKISKKISVFIIVMIMTVGMIGCSAVMKETTEYKTLIESVPSNESYYQEEAAVLEDQIAGLKKLLQEGQITETQVPAIREELYRLEEEYIYCDVYGNYASEHKIKNTSFRYALLETLISARQRLLGLEYNGNTDSEEYLLLQTRCAELEDLIENRTYAEYLELENARIQADPTLSDAEREAALSYNAALLQLCPTGEYASEREQWSAENLLRKKSLLDASLARNADLEMGGNLTQERRAAMERDLLLVNAKISAGFLQTDSGETREATAYRMTSSLGFVFVVIILILLAGSMMSHEMATGTIKSLIIAPVRRWKIYTAKYLALLAAMLALTLYTYGVSSLINGLLFGFDSFEKQLVLVAGETVTMNFFLYEFLAALCNMVPLLVFLTFAYMLSIVTKNTAASVSVSLGIYLGGSFLHMLLSGVLSSYPYLLKFLPFSNFDLFSKIFYTSSDSADLIGMLFGGIEGSPWISLVFSVFYIIILLACMISVSMDHFCRRDIK